MMLSTEGFFIDIFKNARENSVIILDEKGNILEVNKGFIKAFRYQLRDISGKHFRLLFTDKDQQSKKPEKEIKAAIANGSKSDNNYLVTKEGNTVWVMGESVLVQNSNKEKYIVKIIQNIHAQKQLEHFLMESEDFLDVIFDSLKDTSLVVLDSGLKILKTNKTFLKMFSLSKMPPEQSRLSQLDNHFWRGAEIKKRLLEVLVNNKPIKNEPYTYKTKAGKEKSFIIDSKLMEAEAGGKRILLVIKHG